MTPKQAIHQIKIYSVTTGKRYYEIADQLNIDTNRFYSLTRGDRRAYPHEIEKIKQVTTDMIG